MDAFRRFSFGNGHSFITSGPDGRLWFTENAAAKVGAITTGGQISELAVASFSAPSGITTGADGNLWFAESGRGVIAKMTTARVVTEFPLPKSGFLSAIPYAIVNGPDGNLWFTDWRGSVGRMTPSGTLTQYPLESNSQPNGIVAAPDGNLYFVYFTRLDNLGNYQGKVARIVISNVTAPVKSQLTTALFEGPLETLPLPDQAFGTELAIAPVNPFAVDMAAGVPSPDGFSFFDTLYRLSFPGVQPPPATTSGNFIFSAFTNDPVNTFTGELVSSEPADLNLRGPMPLFFRRYYASMIQRDGRITGRMGDNWLHNFEMTLTQTGNQIEVVTSRGRVIEFEKIGSVWSLTGKSDIPFKLAESGVDFILGDPLSNRLFTFNNSGKLTRIEDGKGNTHTLTYGGNDLTQVADGLGRALTFTYDGSGHLSAVSDGTRTVSFGYTGNNLTSFTDALGKVTTYSYDLAHSVAGLMTAKTLPAGNVPYIQTYDPDGQVATQTDANGNAYTLTYGAGETTLTDPLGRTRRHTHTAQGELTSFTDESGQSFTMGYDGSNRRTSLVDRLGDTTSYPYDAASGKPASVTQADGTTTTFSYTSRTLSGIEFFDLTGITHPDGTTEGFIYDANGNLLSRADQAGNVWSYTNNSRGQLLTATNPAGGVTTLTYNANGTPASARDHAGNTTTYGYDALSRLILLTHPDATTRGYTYDNLGRLTNDGARTYTWDLASRLTSYTEGGNPVTFTYDAAGHRLTRTAGGATRSYVWNYAFGLPSISVERQGASDLRYYVHTPGGSLLYSVEANDNARSFYHYDEMGSTLFLTDNSGAVTASYAYTPYGALLASSGGGDNLFTFLGEWGVTREGPSGLHYMRARYYDSQSARFISRDPVPSVRPRSINPYQYAVGNPARYVDPRGTQVDIDPRFGLTYSISGNIDTSDQNHALFSQREANFLKPPLILTDIPLLPGFDERWVTKERFDPASMWRNIWREEELKQASLMAGDILVAGDILGESLSGQGDLTQPSGSLIGGDRGRTELTAPGPDFSLGADRDKKIISEMIDLVSEGVERGIYLGSGGQAAFEENLKIIDQVIFENARTAGAPTPGVTFEAPPPPLE